VPLSCPEHIAIDSRGNIFVEDCQKSRILLLDAQLKLRRIIVDEHQLKYRGPAHLCYNEQSGQLLVGFYHFCRVAVYDVLRR